MIVVRFKVQCKPEKSPEVKAAFGRAIAPSRAVDGVISFDIGQDVLDPNTFIATEVFADRAALDRQQSLSQVSDVLAILGESLIAEPEATIFHVASSEPHSG